MDIPSSSSKLSWLWVIEALASYNQFPIHTLQALIDSAPVSHDDFSKNTREFIALRCLEELSSFSSSFSSSTLNSSRIPIDPSLTSHDVLNQILDLVASSNLNMSNFGAEVLKWDLNPFIMHKRASKMKCHLEKMKDSILDGTLQFPDKLKERSGLFKTNEGKRDDRSAKGDGKSTCAEGMGAKENSACLLLKDGNKASKKSLPGNSRLCSKRTGVDLADENSGSCLNDNEVCIIENDEFLRSTEKTKLNASTDFASNKEKQVSRLGKEVSENLIEEIQISKKFKFDTETLCDESIEDIHTRCTTSNLCQSSGQHKVIHGESDIPFNTTLTPQHTCDGKTNDTVQVDPIPINDGKANKNQHMTKRSQPQQKKPNVASSNVSQKRVASDKGVVDIVSEAELSSDSDMYHNEKIALTAKKNELLKSRHTFGQPQQKKPNVASSNVSQKRVASDKGVVDIVSEAELSSDSDMYHNEKIALTAKKNELLRSRHTFGQPQQKKPNVASSNVSQKRVASDKGVVDIVSEAELSSDSDMYHNEKIALIAKKNELLRSRHTFGQPQQKKPNVASSNVSQKRVASDKGVVDIVSEAELSSDSDMYHNEKIALIAKKNELLRSRHTFGQPQQKKPNVASSNVSQKRVASDKGVVDIVSEAELSSDSDMYHNEKIALTAKKNELLRSRHTFGQPQQKKPNVASSNVSQKRVASHKDVVDIVSDAELSSDSDMYHNEEIALTAKKDEFRSGMTESTGQNVCIKCNEVGQLLVCKTSTCSLMVHKNCLGDSAQLDANGNFLCPFCEYSHAISKYLEAKKSASLAKKQLAIFKSKGIRN